MKLLCVGDIHLGRRPSRVPKDVLARCGMRELSPTGAWERTVREASLRGVDAVLLAGDVVEQNDDFYEAYSDLSRGIEQLAADGIPVLAVAGNHDVEVLPRLADTLSGFRLLGRNGQWESAILTTDGGEQVRILGWSFPASVVDVNPLAEGLPPRDAATTLGLLHCDRDQTGSRYAPVRSSDLEAAAVDGWLLGHIHRPDPLSGPRPIGYLGSLTGMDPGEPGAHGPWLLDTAAASGLSIQQLPLAPLRWEELAIPLDDLDHPEDVHKLITAALDNLHDEITRTGATPRAVGCRLRLTGRTPFREHLTRILEAEDPTQLDQDRQGIAYFVDRWRLDALPALDLDDLARASDPAGLLARKLLTLRDRDSAQRRELIAAAQRRFSDQARDRAFAGLGAEAPDAEQTAVILERAALHALDKLLAQRDEAR